MGVNKGVFAVVSSAALQSGADISDLSNKPQSLAGLGNQILTSPGMVNAFMGCLVNRISETFLFNKEITNPLGFLRNNDMPFGYATENIFVNPAQKEAYPSSDTESNPFTIHKPDVKNVTIERNREDQYPVTVFKKELQSAFLSWDKMTQLVDKIIGSLYDGNEVDSYHYTRDLIAAPIMLPSAVNMTVPTAKIVNVPYVLGDESVNNENAAKSFTKQLKNWLAKMVTPSSNCNNWHDYAVSLNRAEVNTTAVTTRSQIDDIYIFISSDIKADIDVNVIANAFNRNAVDIEKHFIVLDDFGTYGTVENEDTGEVKKLYAVAVDKTYLQITSYDREITDQWNAKGRYWNYFYSVWESYGVLPFANAVAFVHTSTDAEMYISPSTASVGVSETVPLTITNATDPVHVFSSDTAKATVAIDTATDIVTVTGVAAGTADIFAIDSTNKTVKSTITVTA